MSPELNPMDPAIERAVAEIRDEAIDPAVMEAAAERVWKRLSAGAGMIRGCGDFQALIPQWRAGRLSEARVLLLKDHLHQCVACRHVYEGKVVTIPAAEPARRPALPFRRAMAAAGILAVAGVTIWLAYDRYGRQTGPAIVASLDGTLYAVTADSIRPLAKGDALPDGVELRTAKDSDAMLRLADGSQVEMRERSSLSTSREASGLTVHLGRGSVLVEAKHRTQGHLYVDTADCRVAVTGTVFDVTAGMKGSRVVVLQGEVHVTAESADNVLHAGQQTVIGASVEPEPAGEEIAWSRNRAALAREFHASLDAGHLPALRYSSRLLARLPATTSYVISIPNLEQYLGDAETVLRGKMAADPALSSLWNGRLGAVMDTVRDGSSYLGDEIDIAGGKAPVGVAEAKRPGFEEFVRQKKIPLFVEDRGGLVLFSPERAAVEEEAAAIDSGFAQTPFYARIAASFRQGAGLLLWADLGNLHTPLAGARYFMAEQKQAGDRMVASASLGFDGPRTGLAAQLAAPAPMGSMDYVSPDALAMLGFVVKDPGAIIDSALALAQGSMAAGQQALAEEQRNEGFDVRHELAASLGGEFTIAVDGPLMPVPSWKLVAEVYDQARFQASLMRFVEAYNQSAAKSDKRQIRTAQETVGNRIYYLIAVAGAGAMLEAHYTFDRGYLIAGPTRALVTHALEIQSSGISIKHAGKFLNLTPRDRQIDFSAVVYQNLGTSLAPLVDLARAFNGGRGSKMLDSMSDVKPSLFAVYGEPDRITMASNGDVLGASLESLLNGDLRQLAGLGQMFGTRAHSNSYPGR